MKSLKLVKLLLLSQLIFGSVGNVLAHDEQLADLSNLSVEELYQIGYIITAEVVSPGIELFSDEKTISSNENEYCYITLKEDSYNANTFFAKGRAFIFESYSDERSYRDDYKLTSSDDTAIESVTWRGPRGEVPTFSHIKKACSKYILEFKIVPKSFEGLKAI